MLRSLGATTKEWGDFEELRKNKIRFDFFISVNLASGQKKFPEA